jgi:hypothetical protein
MLHRVLAPLKAALPSSSARPSAPGCVWVAPAKASVALATNESVFGAVVCRCDDMPASLLSAGRTSGWGSAAATGTVPLTRQ